MSFVPFSLSMFNTCKIHFVFWWCGIWTPGNSLSSLNICHAFFSLNFLLVHERYLESFSHWPAAIRDAGLQSPSLFYGLLWSIFPVNWELECTHVHFCFYKFFSPCPKKWENQTKPQVPNEETLDFDCDGYSKSGFGENNVSKYLSFLFKACYFSRVNFYLSSHRWLWKACNFPFGYFWIF